jgi:hypothetical protein
MPDDYRLDALNFLMPRWVLIGHVSPTMLSGLPVVVSRLRWHFRNHLRHLLFRQCYLTMHDFRRQGKKAAFVVYAMYTLYTLYTKRRRKFGK